jgi:hypothetical protein
MPQIIDPDTGEKIFTVTTEEVSLRELIGYPDREQVSTKRTLQYPSFVIFNNDDVNTLLIKIQNKDRKGMPIFPKLSFALVSKNPAAIRLKAEE